jgi:hypothetical protein
MSYQATEILIGTGINKPAAYRHYKSNSPMLQQMLEERCHYASILGTSMESLHPFTEVLGKASNVKHEKPQSLVQGE